MNEQPPASPRPLARDRIHVQLNRLLVSRHRRMFGIAEMIGLAGSALILIAVIISYFYFLMPARSRLASLQLERSRLQNQLRNEEDVVRQDESTEATVENIR